MQVHRPYVLRSFQCFQLYVNLMRREITSILISHLKLAFLDDFYYQVLRIVGALVGYYQKSCFVDLINKPNN